jgi:hypothetical protein
MLRTALVVLLFASPALAQDSANALAAAGCAANEVHFDVKTDKKRPPHSPTLASVGVGDWRCLVGFCCRPLWNAANEIRR